MVHMYYVFSLKVLSKCIWYKIAMLDTFLFCNIYGLTFKTSYFIFFLLCELYLLCLLYGIVYIMYNKERTI